MQPGETAQYEVSGKGERVEHVPEVHHEAGRHGTRIEVLLDIDLLAQDAATVERFESTLSAADEITELRRLFGKPDHFVRAAVADLSSYETFLSSRVMTIPGVGRVHSRFAMKNIKGAAADL
jgi:DNA-binding Lrp family transcriptional regulator